MEGGKGVRDSGESWKREKKDAGTEGAGWVGGKGGSLECCRGDGAGGKAEGVGGKVG